MPSGRSPPRYDPGTERRGRPREGPLRRLVRDVPALLLARTGPARDVPRRGGSGCRTWRRWASTCSTCRRSTPSAGSFRKGPQQHRRGPPPAIRAAPGRSARRRAATRRSTRSLARSRTCSHLRGRGRRPGDRARARHRVPVLARPPLRRASTRSGFGRGPDGTIQYAENPPKKYQDIYPFDFETDDWRALWDGAEERRPSSGSSRGSGSSASTTRTPSRSTSGSG